MGEITSLYKNLKTIIFSFNENNDGLLLPKYKDFVLGIGFNRKESSNKIIYNIEKKTKENEKRNTLKEKYKEKYRLFFDNLKENLE